MSHLKRQIQDDMKVAMRARAKQRLATIRLINAAIKQREVDERIELSDAQVLAVLEKMVKQRRESVKQYVAGDRQDLADIELAEIEVLQGYLPKPLSDAELDQVIGDAVVQVNPQGMQDMGRLMGLLKPKLQGRADMALVSQKIKQQLA